MTPEHFDAIVIGSGFGGSVTAHQLAQGGMSVCLLERGRAYPPGSFPRSPRHMNDNFWDPAAGLHGLFSLWSFRGLEAVVGSGLGGGSLIYANVLIRKDERWFVKEQPFKGGYEHWPIDRADLDPHYDRVEPMLGATPFPYPDVPKTMAMRDAAEKLGLDWRLPNLAVTFAGADGVPQPGVPIPEAEYPNYHGLPRHSCRLCGECDIGCNDGAKNTLDHNYLSAARAAGADIRTRCEVRRISPLTGGGYEVAYVVYGPEHEGRAVKPASLPHETVTADRLILAAGALGTPYLLLRNRVNFPALGPALGSRFSGNGDLLTLAMRARSEGGPRRLDAAYGPVITSTMRMADTVDGGDGRGFYIQDAGFPQFVEWILEATLTPSSFRRLSALGVDRIKRWITRHPDTDLSAEVSAALGQARLSSTSMPLLAMGRDTPDGQLRLRHGYLHVNWRSHQSADLLKRMRETMKEIAWALEADHQDNPLWKLRRRVITVHPLGGAPMGRHIGEGVVDSYGQAFGHPDLYVVDGAVMPGPVGPNPSLTIAAFADRVAQRILETSKKTGGSRSRPVAVSSPTRAPRPQPTLENERATTLSFTEEMKGHISLGDLPFDEAARKGAATGRPKALMFRLTIDIVDVDRFIDDPEREGVANGWVHAHVLGGRLPVTRGVFNLFVPGDEPNVKKMHYRLWFADSVGNHLTLVGYKTVRDDPGVDVWPDTSTLYIKVLKGHCEIEDDEQSDVVATGILRIQVVDFLQQLASFRVKGPNAAARTRALSSFGRMFLGELWKVYGARASKGAG